MKTNSKASLLTKEVTRLTNKYPEARWWRLAELVRTLAKHQCGFRIKTREERGFFPSTSSPSSLIHQPESNRPPSRRFIQMDSTNISLRKKLLSFMSLDFSEFHLQSHSARAGQSSNKTFITSSLPQLSSISSGK